MDGIWEGLKLACSYIIAMSKSTYYFIFISYPDGCLRGFLRLALYHVGAISLVSGTIVATSAVKRLVFASNWSG
jgi:hypothetical protein